MYVPRRTGPETEEEVGGDDGDNEIVCVMSM